MSHRAQVLYCQQIRDRFPEHFKGVKVLDCGSLDINGNNRYLFTDSQYVGIDVGAGKNVDVVSLIHEYDAPDASFDTIISTECFEHDIHYPESLANIVRMLKPGGFFLFTCATLGRREHGTTRREARDSPLTAALGGEWATYYKNLTEEDIRKAIPVDDLFSSHEFSVEHGHKDLRFWGVKR